MSGKRESFCASLKCMRLPQFVKLFNCTALLQFYEEFFLILPLIYVTQTIIIQSFCCNLHKTLKLKINNFIISCLEFNKMEKKFECRNGRNFINRKYIHTPKIKSDDVFARLQLFFSMKCTYANFELILQLEILSSCEKKIQVLTFESCVVLRGKYY